MPIPLTHPGVYIEEVPSGVRTIMGVATSITAFIGRALRGPVNEATRIASFADYERTFGGLWELSTMSYAVQQFFLNGGTDAVIVRVHRNAAKATLSLAGPSGSLVLAAANEGAWGNQLQAVVDHATKDTSDTDLFNLTIRELVSGTTTDEARLVETFRNISRDSDSPRFITTVLEQESKLVRVEGAVPAARPAEGATAATASGDDGSEVQDAQISAPNLEGNKQGLWALEKTDLFNLLCVPPLGRETDISSSTRDAAAKYCRQRRAMFVADPPRTWTSVETAEAEVSTLVTSYKNNVAAFFPRVRMQDALKENRLEEFAPCGAVAGIFARTDAQRGIWKAPAGLEATIAGARKMAYPLTDAENGRLNPLGLNCLRTFPVFGHVVWGARTLDGADMLASEWKYIPVRRLALNIEESLYRGTQWVVFEPNDEPLWAQIRLNVGAYMHSLFRQGAFQGQSPREAYFVKCDKETTTEDDRNRGIVNILVGFAPLRPAEFVVIKIQQIAGQTAA